MTAIYLTGASGTGKTTLAKYIAETYGVGQLPSAARAVMAKRGWDFNKLAKVQKDRDAYHEFQTDVANTQIVFEYAAESDNATFVTDRCIDHLVYSALYGGRPDAIAAMPTVKAYLASFLSTRRRFVLFHVHPCTEVFVNAIADGDRNSYLGWPRVLQFDGALEFYLRLNAIPHVQIDVPDLGERKRLIDAHLTAIGLIPKKGV